MLCVCDQTKYIKHVDDEKCSKEFHLMCAHSQSGVFYIQVKKYGGCVCVT